MDSYYGIQLKACPLGKCKRNCRANPFCLNGLGVDRWSSDVETWKRKVSRLEVVEARDTNTQPAGIANAGNSCYLNSYLQLWYNDERFRQAVFDWRQEPPCSPDGKSKETQRHTAISMLRALFARLQITPYESVDVKEFMDALSLDREQQDPQEFAMLFQNMLQNTRGAQPLYRVMSEQYEIRLTLATKCVSCNFLRNDISVSPQLYLQIKKRHGEETLSTLAKAIDGSFEDERIELACRQFGCQGREVVRTQRIERLPPILMIQLMRYNIDPETGRKKKLCHAVSFPREFSFADYCSNADAEQYDLSAVMVHEGSSANSGHYYDLIKGENGWFKYNDATVSPLKLVPGTDNNDNAEEQNRARGDQLTINKNVYMLVYRQRNAAKHNHPEVPADLHESIGVSIWDEFMADQKQSNSSRDVTLQFIDSRSARINDLWNQLIVNDDSDLEDYSFIPTKALQAVQQAERNAAKTAVDRLEDDLPVDVERCDVASRVLVDDGRMPAAEVCVHGSPSARSLRRGEWKAVNTATLRRMIDDYFPAYGSTGVHAFIQRTDLCRTCFDREQRGEKMRADLEKKYPQIVALLGTQHKLEEFRSMSPEQKDEYMLVHCDLMTQNRWKTQLVRCIESATKPILNEILFPKKISEPSDVDMVELPNGNTEGSATGSSAHPLQKTGPTEATTSSDENMDEDHRFNAFVLCRHDAVDPCVKLVAIRKTAWNLMTSVVGVNSTVEVKGSTYAPCAECRAAIRDDQKTERSQEVLSQTLREMFPQLGRDRDIGRTMQDNKQGYHAICRRFVNELTSFIKSKGREKLPAKICQRCILCEEHGRLVFPPTCDKFALNVVVISEMELVQLRFNEAHPFEVNDDQLITVSRVAPDLVDALSCEPPPCNACYTRNCEQPTRNFKDEPLFIKMVESVEQLQNGLDAAGAGGAWPILRRSTRRRPNPQQTEDTRSISVSSTTTLEMLKLQIMNETDLFPNEQRLSIEGVSDASFDRDPATTTLADIGVRARMVVRVAKSEDAKAIKLDRDRGGGVRPERGFKDTALSSN